MDEFRKDPKTVSKKSKTAPISNRVKAPQKFTGRVALRLDYFSKLDTGYK